MADSADIPLVSTGRGETVYIRTAIDKGSGVSKVPNRCPTNQGSAGNLKFALEWQKDKYIMPKHEIRFRSSRIFSKSKIDFIMLNLGWSSKANVSDLKQW